MRELCSSDGTGEGANQYINTNPYALNHCYNQQQKPNFILFYFVFVILRLTRSVGADPL